MALRKLELLLVCLNAGQIKLEAVGMLYGYGIAKRDREPGNKILRILKSNGMHDLP